MNEKKVETIKACKPPTSVGEVQIFMGFANFYQRFMKNFLDICTPITNLTTGARMKFVWGKDQQEAFEYLKRCFTTAPILCHFHPDHDTVVETDASDYTLGCIPLQFQEKRFHPFAFNSRKLNSTERNYDIEDKELLAILVAFLKWKHYLQGTEKSIMVYTDHANPQYPLTSKASTARQIRKSQKLCNFNFVIVYRPGVKGGKRDALSRQQKYRPEVGAMQRQQHILRPEHFCSYQITIVQGDGSPPPNKDCITGSRKGLSGAKDISKTLVARHPR